MKDRGTRSQGYHPSTETIPPGVFDERAVDKGQVCFSGDLFGNDTMTLVPVPIG
jgi:hypothetical protein